MLGGTGQENFDFQFEDIGKYEVCLEVSNHDCTDESKYCRTIEVKQDFKVSECCDKRDRDRYVYKDYAPNRKMKAKIWQTNYVLRNAIGSSTNNYHKTLIGWGKRNAEIIYTDIAGLVYFRDEDLGLDCEKTISVPLLKDSVLNKNEAILRVPVGQVFWTKKESITSKHKIKYYDQWITHFLSLTTDKDDCD